MRQLFLEKGLYVRRIMANFFRHPVFGDRINRSYANNLKQNPCSWAEIDH